MSEKSFAAEVAEIQSWYAADLEKAARSQRKWDLYHLTGCILHVRRKSKDPSRRNGCIITGKYNQVLMNGFNGFPIGIEDDPAKVPERYEGEARYVNTIHAETSALLLAARTGVATDGATLHCSLFPCLSCALQIIHAGIRRVVVPYTENEARYNFDESKARFAEAGVEVVTYTQAEIDEYIQENQ